MKHWKLGIIAAAFSGSLLAAPMPVVASFSILGDVTQQIGGERVAVQTLVGADQDAHVYQLNSGDIRKIRAAKLVLVNGLGFEKAELARAVQQSKVPMAVASQGIKPMAAADDHGHSHGGHNHDHGTEDPHVWNDPVLMQTYAQNVANALIKADPAGKSHYQQRLKNYQTELGQLNTWAAQSFNAIPAAQRKVLTGHDAFGYFGQEYHVSFMAPVGFSTEAEASASGVASLIKQIKEQQVKSYFIENQTDPRLVKQIAAASGAQPGGELYPEALSGPQGPATTYIKAFKHNVETIVASMK